MTEVIGKYGLLAIFGLVFLEYACFPLPSEILLPLSGAFARSQDFNFFLLVFISTIMALLGSFVCYGVGFFGGTRILDLIEKKFPKTKKGMETSKSQYLKHSKSIVLVGRVIPVCRTYISFVAGMYKGNFLIYSIFTFIGAFIWNLILLGLGYYGIGSMSSNQAIYEKYKVLTLIIIGVLLIVSILVKEKKRAKE